MTSDNHKTATMLCVLKLLRLFSKISSSVLYNFNNECLVSCLSVYDVHLKKVNCLLGNCAFMCKWCVIAVSVLCECYSAFLGQCNLTAMFSIVFCKTFFF